jgi:hypothetical protein
MSTNTSTYSIDSHFTNKESDVRKIYEAILKKSNKLGVVKEEAKKTSIHLVRKSAFAGIATRKSFLILTFKSANDLTSKRISKRERASANRWHMEVKLDSPEAVDAEVTAWLKSSYDISD